METSFIRYICEYAFVHLLILILLILIDKKPYTTLTYANGRGYVDNIQNGERVDLTTKKFGNYCVYSFCQKKKISRRLTKIFNAIADKDTRYAAAVPVEVETHAGEEVGIFAKGCHAHLFSSVMNQNTIPHIMAYAACIGPGLKSCD